MLAAIALAVLAAAAGGAEPDDTPRLSAAAIEAMFHHGEPALAMQRLDQALTDRPDDASLRFLRGVLLSESGHGGEAAAVFEAMTQSYPDLPEPYNNLAVIRAADGELDHARELLETALRIDPGYRVAQRNLGDVLLRLALRAYETAAGAARPDPRLQRKLQSLRQLIDPR